MRQNRVVIYTVDCEGVYTNPDNVVSCVLMPSSPIEPPKQVPPGNWWYRDGKLVPASRLIMTVNGGGYKLPVIPLRVYVVQWFHFAIIIGIGIYRILKAKLTRK
jgi:hypothetical protein